jgi:hypothetical protein
MRAKTMLLLAGLVPVVLGAGCGDDSNEEQRLSKREYIAKANASCATHEKQAGAAFGRIIGEGQPTAAEAQRFLAEAVVPALRDGVAERAKLSAPQGDEAEIRAINTAARKAVTGFERIAANRAQSLRLMRGQLDDPATEVDALNRRYGVDKCGGGN